MKLFKNILTVAALALVGALTVGCANSDNEPNDEQLPGAGRIVIMTTTLSFDSKAETRALTEDGTKTFAENDQVAVIYVNTSNQYVKAVSQKLKTTDISGDGKKATISVSLIDPKTGGQPVCFVYPASLADETQYKGSDTDFINLTELQGGQDGTFANIAQWDAAKFSGTLTVTGTTAEVSTYETVMSNPLCIGKFTIKDGSTPINNKITKLTVTTSDGPNTYTYTVKRTASADAISVAMVPANYETITITAYEGTDAYSKTVTGKQLEASKIYPINVTAAFDPNATPLTFEALADVDSKGVFFHNHYSDDRPTDIDSKFDVEYSLNGGEWTKLEWADGNDFRSKWVYLTKKGDKVAFRSNNKRGGKFIDLRCNLECAVYGNVMSLYNKEEFPTLKSITDESAFEQLFYTAYSQDSYINNHETKNIALPATTLSSRCYAEMFYHCNNLTRTPELPAENLAAACYTGMFSVCKKLATVPERLPATTLKNNCYSYMFSECSNITTAPVLPATKLLYNCYYEMFKSCSKLNSVTCLATEIASDAENCTAGWLTGVASTGTLYRPEGSPLPSSSIPSGWSQVNYVAP